MPILAAERLNDALNAMPLPPLWVVFGDAPLLVEETLQAIRDAAVRAGFAVREPHQIDKPEDLAAVQASWESASLFAERRCLEIRLPSIPTAPIAKTLTALIAREPVEAIAMLILPPLDWTQRKSAWFEALVRHAMVVEANAPAPEALPAWWAARLASQQQSAGAALLSFLAETHEGNLLAAKQTLALLALLYPPGELSEDAVRAVVRFEARFDPEQLRVAVLVGERARVLKVLQGLQEEGVAEPLVLWALASALRWLAQAVEGGGAIDESGWKEARIFDRALRQRLQTRVRTLAPQASAATLLALARLDRILKGAEPGDFWQEVERLALTHPWWH